MRMAIILEEKEIRELSYPVVVEMWDKAKEGRHRRAYHAEFNETERKKARELYNLFYGWYLRTGPPQTYTTTIQMYQFIQRLCNFFGGL